MSDIWFNLDDYRSDRLHLYMWDETHCRKLDDQEAHALAHAKLRIFFEPARWLAVVANAKNSVAAAKLHIVVSAEIQDHTSHPMIPLLNGYIHLDDGNLLEHMKEDYL